MCRDPQHVISTIKCKVGSSKPWGQATAKKGIPWLGLRPQRPLPADDTPFEVGIRVQIHSQEEPPIIDQLGFGAAPGYQTFVSCQKQQVSSLCSKSAQPPSSSCTPAVSQPFSLAPNSSDFSLSQNLLNPILPQLSFLPPPWGDCSSTFMDPNLEEPSDLLGSLSPSSNPSPPYSLMGCRMACEARYVARKCGCRMMHMPGKELGSSLGVKEHE